MNIHHNQRSMAVVERFRKIRNSKIYKRIFFLLALYFIFELIKIADSFHYIAIPPFLSSVVRVSIFGIIVFIVATIMLRLTERKFITLLQDEMRIEHRILVVRVYSIFLYGIALALLLWRIGVSSSNITIFLGLATTGIAFALRDVLLSFLAWIIILSRQPFVLKDVIKIGEEIGIVDHVGMFFTTLQDTHGTILRIPNKTILEKPTYVYNGGLIYIQMTIPLKRVPKEINLYFKRIKESIKENVDGAKNIDVGLNSNIDGWFIAVSFPLLFSNFHRKNNITLEIYNECKDITKIKKQE